MCQKRDDLDKQILQCRSELSKICPAILVQSIRTKIQEVNSKLFNHLHRIKAHKLEELTGPSNTRKSSIESLSTVVTIPENLPLSNAEKSVLSKGLNFVRISKKLDEFSVKQDVEKFLRRVQLKVASHPKWPLRVRGETLNKNPDKLYIFWELNNWRLPYRIYWKQKDKISVLKI